MIPPSACRPCPQHDRPSLAARPETSAGSYTTHRDTTPRSSFRANRNALAAGAQANARGSSLQLSRPELLVEEVTRQVDVCMHALSASASSGCRACRGAQLSSLRKSVSWRLPRNMTCLLHLRRAGLLAHASNSKEAPSAGQAFHRRCCQGTRPVRTLPGRPLSVPFQATVSSRTQPEREADNPGAARWKRARVRA
jgi:hypothetical protein